MKKQNLATVEVPVYCRTVTYSNFTITEFKTAMKALRHSHAHQHRCFSETQRGVQTQVTQNYQGPPSIKPKSQQTIHGTDQTYLHGSCKPQRKTREPHSTRGPRNLGGTGRNWGLWGFQDVLFLHLAVGVWAHFTSCFQKDISILNKIYKKR